MKEVFQLMIRNTSLSQLYPLAIVIVMSYNYRPMYLGAVNKLFYKEKTKFLWKLTLMAAIINVSLNLILMPFYGYKVAAFTTFAAFLYMGYAGFYYKIFKEINVANYYQFGWLLATIVLAFCAYEIVEYGFIIKIAISIVYSVIAAVLLFKLNKKF
ncbi:hypothetical protein D3C85_1332200 [compost metagenome]